MSSNEEAAKAIEHMHDGQVPTSLYLLHAYLPD